MNEYLDIITNKEIEEAAKNHATKSFNSLSSKETVHNCIEDFIAGADYIKNKTYTEIEVKSLLATVLNEYALYLVQNGLTNLGEVDNFNLKSWFNDHKKKEES
jgi:hypothetical protein